jgi:SAM-dependent methyltransferase
MQETHVDGAPVEPAEQPGSGSDPRAIRITRPVRESVWRKRVRDREVNLHGFTYGTRPLEIELEGGRVICRHWSLPLATASVDEIAIEDVLEYVRDDFAFYRELHRVLRPGGRVRLRVPNAGRLDGFDGLNLYKYLTDITKRGLRVPETDEIGFRRHLPLREVADALGPDFDVTRAWTTSLAFAEVLNAIALALLTWLPETPDAYLKVRPLIDRLSRLEARIRPGMGGFWLHIEARKLPAGTSRSGGSPAGTARG